MALYSRATIHPPLAFTHDAQSRIFINAIYRYDLTQILKWRQAIIPNPICIIRAPWTVTFAVCCVFHSTGYIKCYIIFMNEMPKTKLLRETFVRRLFFSNNGKQSKVLCLFILYVLASHQTMHKLGRTTRNGRQTDNGNLLRVQERTGHTDARSVLMHFIFWSISLAVDSCLVVSSTFHIIVCNAKDSFLLYHQVPSYRSMTVFLFFFFYSQL